MLVGICFFKQKTAYEMRISDWSSDVCSSDLNCTPLPSPATTWCSCQTAVLTARRGGFSTACERERRRMNEVISPIAIAQALDAYWSPKVIAEPDDSSVKVAKERKSVGRERVRQ